MYLLVGSRTLNLDPDSNPDPESDPELIMDPDPNLQIISDPAGSGCTTLGLNSLTNMRSLLTSEHQPMSFWGEKYNKGKRKGENQCCGSEIIIFGSGSGSGFGFNFGSGFGFGSGLLDKSYKTLPNLSSRKHRSKIL